MAGNSKRKGAVRNTEAKKPRAVGSGGNRRQGLEGKGPTPKATERPGHVTGKRVRAEAAQAAKQQGGRGRGPRGGSKNPDIVAGRNQVLEAVLAGVPARTLLVQRNIDADPRIKQALTTALEKGLEMRECRREELDELAGGVHQGIVLEVAPYEYTDIADLLFAGTDRRPALLVALDGVTDTRNLGAIARSAAAFDGTGIVIPSRRSATVTAASWRTSAGALAHIPVAMVTNLNRTIEDAKEAGFTVVGLAGEGSTDIDALGLGNDPVLLVIGGEGKGLSRLVAQNCDLLASIPINGRVESLNAAVAAGIALHAVVSARA